MVKSGGGDWWTRFPLGKKRMNTEKVGHGQENMSTPKKGVFPK